MNQCSTVVSGVAGAPNAIYRQPDGTLVNTYGQVVTTAAYGTTCVTSPLTSSSSCRSSSVPTTTSCRTSAPAYSTAAAVACACGSASCGRGGTATRDPGAAVYNPATGRIEVPAVSGRCAGSRFNACAGPSRAPVPVPCPTVDPCTGVVRTYCPYVQRNPAKCPTYVTISKIEKDVDPCEPVEQPCQRRRCCDSGRRTICYNLPPRRENCYPQDPQPYELAYLDNFETFRVGQRKKDRWNYFTNDDDFIANDGCFKTGPNGLTLNAKVFTKTYPPRDVFNPAENPMGFLDHFKTFIILNSQFAVPDCGQIYLEATFSNQTFNTNIFPSPPWTPEEVLAFPNPVGDVRNAVSAISMIDFETGLHLAHLINNQNHFALYEVLPFANDETTGFERASFAGVYYLVSRNESEPIKDYTVAGIGLDRLKGAFWYINGAQARNEIKLGHRPNQTNAIYSTSGAAGRITPRCVQVGMGHFTFMDGQRQEIDFIGEVEEIQGVIRLSSLPYISPYRPSLPIIPVFGEPIVVPPQPPTAFVVETENLVSRRIYGQGAVMNIQQIKVEYRC